MYNQLTKEEIDVIENKGTELAFSGIYDNFYKEGIYICKKCNNPLFSSKTKFDTGCGWPAFDNHIPNSVRREKDTDGYRVEIICNNCGGHLGHVFEGEHFTSTNTRHCVNSISIRFVPSTKTLPKVIS